MQLLSGCPIPSAEFASLSLLIKPDGGSKAPMCEPMVVASPFAVISNTTVQDVLKELHNYITSVMMAASNNVKDRLSIELNREDVALMDETQIFRPIGGCGMALHFRFHRGDNAVLSKLISVVLSSIKSGSIPNLNVPPNVLGVVFCVGFSGLPYAYASSPLQYSIAPRLDECVKLLIRNGRIESDAIRSILTSMLLTENDVQRTNDMVEASNLIPIPPSEDSEKARGLALHQMGLISPMGSVLRSKRSSIKGDIGGDSEDMAQILAVPLILGMSSAEATRLMTEHLNILSVAESDTFLRKYDVPGQDRKTNLDLVGAGKVKSKRRIRKGESRDPDFDGFDYSGPVREVINKRGIQRFNDKEIQNSRRGSASAASSGSPGLIAPKGANLGAASRRASASPAITSPPTLQAPPQASSRRASTGLGNLPKNSESSLQKGRSRHNFEEESVTSRSNSVAPELVASQGRMQVNIALNEDLSCSYKHSQLSSCNIEGVVQVQVKSNAPSSVPFFLLVRDISGHLDSLQENKKFAEDVSETMNGKEDETFDQKFAVSVPKADNYFPVLKYKCIPEVRPVPIRVQTRVKVGSGLCRVALQISSNPRNDSPLTDLNIIMGVPEHVYGETLATQPPGGVWNESKRSVIWFVAELGCGEKFQLQARFEIDNDIEDEPDFPVLVRSTCLFAQLSDIEIEVRDIPDVYPADIVMKLARRFRLVHRERA